MEEIHSCGNQCKKLNTNEPLMQRMITYVQKFYFNESFFILLWLFTSVVDFFFHSFFFSPRDWNSHWKHTEKSSPSTGDLKKKENKIATNVIDFAKKHTGMYHEIFHPVGCWFYSHLFNINNIILKHCDIFTNFVY